MEKLDKILGKETESKPPPTDASNLVDTAYQANGESAPSAEEDSSGKLFGKKERKDGVNRGKQQKQRRKHRRFAKLKKLLNLGEKLKPIGIGDSGADYDGQAQQRDQGKDDHSAPEADRVDQNQGSQEHLGQTGEQEEVDLQGITPQQQGKSPRASNIEFAEKDYDLYVHVYEARDLMALDSNGCSDPYCRIQLGKSKQKTKTIRKNLNPQWEETFHFASHELRDCLNQSGKLMFELRDKDFLSADEFLGSVVIDLNKIGLETEANARWWKLRGTKHGEMVEDLGEIKLGVCVVNNAGEDEDIRVGQIERLSSERDDVSNRMVSTLCPPRGMVKMVPVIVHTEGNCLYEEPCVYYLSLQVGEVRRLQDFVGDNIEYEGDLPHEQSPGKSFSEAKRKSPNLSIDGTSTSWQMFMDQMEDSTGWQDESEDEPDSEADSDEDDGPGGAEDDGDDPFDDDEENLENPLQAPEAEADRGPASETPMHDKSLYIEASVGSQRRRSRIARLKNRKFSWNQGLPFATTLPLKDKNFKIMLCERDRSNQQTCPVAVAFVSMIKLLKERSEEGMWYKLHDYTQASANEPRLFGAVRLKLRATDSDGRRTLYHQPLFRDSDTSVKKPSDTSKGDASPSKDWTKGAENGYDNYHQADKISSWRPPNIADRFQRQMEGFQRKEIEITNPNGMSRRYQQGQKIGLLAVQAILAIVTILFRVLCLWWESIGRATINLLRNLFPGAIVKKERQTPDDDSQLKPADLALGVVKFVLRSIELRDQPKGKYFCIFKCGPHWGQTQGIRCVGQMELNWEIHLPILEPHSLLTLTVFRDMHRKETTNLRSRPPEFIGKLRLRLNTLQTDELYEAKLPMLGNRKQGGNHNADAILGIKTIYFFEKPVIKKYFQAAQPYDVYALKLGEGNIAKQLSFENRRLCLEWLGSVEPRISQSVAKIVIGTERQQFVFSRAKANWTRFMMEKERFTWIIRFWKRNQAWENPLESISLLCGLVVFAFYPQVVLVGVILTLAFYSFVAAQKRPDKPWRMVMDPDGGSDDENEDESGITQLRKKYFRLVKVALSVQNYLEDFADTLERLHAFINWADPKATLVFIFVCLASVLAITAFGLPTVLSIALCWTVRPPALRSPTPPAPLSFFLRLPTRSDQII